MSKLEKYKWATILLSIIVVVMFIVMLDDQSIIEKMSQQACQTELKAWSTKYKVGSANKWTINSASTAELSQVLDKCNK